MKKWIVLAALALSACGGGEDAEQGNHPRGVTGDSIRIGSHTDLSGGLAIWGVPATNGQRMRYDEANAAGGIHGRKIEFIVEDNQYQVPVAVKVTNKLLNVDEIFLMVGSMGTPMNNAVMPRMFAVDVPNLFPLTGAVSMYEPLHPMKFAYTVSYRDQARGAMAYLVEAFGIRKVCVQALANDYGAEAEIGFHQASAELELEVTYEGRHKAAETDFTGTITGIKNSGCELLVLGPLVKDTIQIYAAARDAGWEAPIVGNMVSYVTEVAEAANNQTEGLYAAASYYQPDFSEVPEDSWLEGWYKKYTASYGEEPVPQSIIGYMIADITVTALDAAGPDLTVEKVLAGIESLNEYVDPFGGPPLSFGPTKHLGANTLILYQVVDGKWEIVARDIPF